jgi:CDP-glucose 4,6-dehydratase
MSSFFRDKRVFITGATGLVGSWLTRALVELGAYTVVLIRDSDPQSELVRSGLLQRVSVVSGSLEDYSSLERAINEHEVDTVFHLGAQTIVGTALRNPLPTFEANIRGTYNLMEACRIHSSLVKRILVASSDKAYGDSTVLPYTEDMPPSGRHPYDVSKSCTDLICQTYFHTYNLPVVIARCGNIFGGGDLNWSRIIPGTIRSILEGNTPVVRSDGTLTRDYVYVQDAVSAYLKMAQQTEHPDVRGEIFNFGPDQPRTVLQVIQAVAEGLGRSDIQPSVQNTAKAEIQNQYLDASKAKRVLGWEQVYSFEQGLQETIGWYKQYLGGVS